MDRNNLFTLWTVLFVLLSQGAWGQDSIKHEEWKEFRRPRTTKERLEFMRPPPIREDKLNDKDLNHSAEYMKDSDFGKDWSWCYSLNGEFVGPYAIGIDNYAYEIDNSTRQKGGLRMPFTIRGIGKTNDSLVVTSWERGVSYYIRGHDICGFTNYKSEHPVKLLSLEDIRKEYCPQVEGDVLYMVNKFFILREEDLYKFTMGFIWKVEVLPSSELAPIKSHIGKPFTIIRIFTKTHHNWHPFFIR